MRPECSSSRPNYSGQTFLPGQVNIEVGRGFDDRSGDPINISHYTYLFRGALHLYLFVEHRIQQHLVHASVF